jgi:polyhydroxybutyrate depolymerase
VAVLLPSLCERILAVLTTLSLFLMILMQTTMELPEHATIEKSSFQVGGKTRTYFVHRPPGRKTAERYPLVLALHGGGSNAEAMMHFSGLNEKSTQAGFIVVYPNGTGRYRNRYTWNAGRCCAYAQRNEVEDVGFIRELIGELKKRYSVDSDRIFATGMSNGAMMVYRLASELADQVAAIAPVAGAMATETCSPSRPVSVVHFHGTNDQFAPFGGGVGQWSLVKISHLSVEYTVKAWVAANGCSPKPIESRVPNRVDDGTVVRSRTYEKGQEGSEFLLYIIEGGGHTWPGRPTPLKRLGKSTRNISANDLMWAFFRRHGR